MKKAVAFAISLAALTALADALALWRGTQLDPWRLASWFGALALILSVFAGFTEAGFARQLRHWTAKSAWTAFAIPFLLLVPYFLFALGTGTFSLGAAARLAAYIALPTALLLPDRLRPANRIGWRDFAAMAALGVPVAGHWLEGVWAWPEEIYFFRPLYSVSVGAYAFMVIRNLGGIGYRLGFRKGDLVDGLVNLVGFSALAIPLGIMLGFIHPHANRVSPFNFAIQLFGIYITVAIPEEFLFRGVLQNFLVRSIAHRRRALYGILIASVIFGASHLHHPPVPNWKYGILATLAGIFYGNAFRTRQRLSASALTHTLVDTLWHFWF